MTTDVTFKAGASGTPYTVKCEGIHSKFAPAVTVLTPGTFRVLEDILGSKTITSFLITWGKVVLTFTFDLVFASDDEYKTFLGFAMNDAFYQTGTANYLQFYWGTTGDPFYTGQNDLKTGGSTNDYQGLFLPGNFDKDVKGGQWKGSIDFVLGVAVKL